jgi:hypothetical protein
MLRTGRAKAGARVSDALSWSCRNTPAGSIGYTAIMDEPGAERLELSYTREHDGEREQVSQTIRLTHTSPQYGGKRWWMICPYRGLRVGKLYKPNGGDRFASRQVWRLGYHSQRIASVERPREALFRLQEKLGGQVGVGAHLRRPKGMWQQTYDRHLERYWELDALCAVEMMAMLERIGGGIRF